jgi:Xaa-Pro aminopeptidase
MEMTRLSDHHGIQALPRDAYGHNDLLTQGLTEAEAGLTVLQRVCTTAGVTEVRVPPDFPFEAGRALENVNIEVHVDRQFFENARRKKTPGELEGIRRAQRAADNTMQAVAELIASPPDNLTAEAVRRFARQRAGVDGQAIEIMQVLPGAQGAVAHIMGTGAVNPHESLIVDIGVHDEDSGAWADMTRTFCIGAPPAELARYHELAVEAISLVYERIRPGVTGHDLHSLVCDLFEAAGYGTERTAREGEVLMDGFTHPLGHGVGLEIHEPPNLDLNGEPLVAGDVIAIEPGLYRSGFGGSRVEDTVYVTKDGFERLTTFPYELGGSRARR